LVLTIKEEQEVQGEIEVLHNKKPIDKDIHLVILRLWNASSDPILVEDFKNSIKMNFGKDALILSGQILESNPPGIKEEIDSNKLIQLDAGSVELKPIWLNEDHSLTMKVLLTKYQGEVITDESRIIVGGFVRDWEKSNYFKFKKVIDRFLEPVNVFLSFFLALFLLL
jgi:hypothetical protein